MKKMMSLALLATLVSCGGSGGSSGKKINVEEFQQAALGVQRGLVSIETKNGTEHEYSGDLDGNYTVSLSTVSIEQYSVILKVDGTKVYTYVEERDLLDGTINKSVEVEDFSEESMREALSFPGANLNGSIFTLNMTQDFDFELGDTAVTTSKYNLKMRIDLANFHCSNTSSVREYDVKLTQNGVVTRSPDAATNSSTRCEAALSTAQLKDLDLSAITFCEESTTEEDEMVCEEQNMEFLTDDL